MKILNLGSLNIDRVYSVPHFVQPKETISAVGYEEFCGGKGLNQSVALARAGALVYHAGAVGKDGEILVSMLESSGVSLDYLRKLDGASGHAVIQIDPSGQNNIIICGGANRKIDKDYIDEVISDFEEGDFLVLQNEISNVPYAMEAAKKKGMTVVFNPSPIDEGVFECDLSLVDYFVLNEVEGQALAGIQSEEPEIIKAALLEKFPDAIFMLTLGENGCYYFKKSLSSSREIFEVDVVDTTGAGDTFLGYFIASVAAGDPVHITLKKASAASAISIGKPGASPSIPDLGEVTNFLLKYPGY